ncbi:MAG: IS200/IS605 family transposase [Desulfuromonadales bacterium]|nr:IS200/IS605 family transposase [Desulfuromonadales bacterium]
MELDKNIHSVFLLSYRLILVVKQRREVFNDALSNRAKEIFQQIAPKYKIALQEWNYEPDHLDILFKAQPKTEITKFLKVYKSVSSRLLKKEFPNITEKLWKGHFWSQSFCLVTDGSVPFTILQQYIESQNKK